MNALKPAWVLAALWLTIPGLAQGVDHSRRDPANRGQGAQIKIYGTVFDAGGRSLSGVVVRFRDAMHPGQAVETRTDEAGNYVQAGLEEGLYEIEVSMLGYRTEHMTLVARSSGNRADFTLSLVNESAALMKPATPAEEFRKHLADARAALTASDLGKARKELDAAAAMGAWDGEYQTLLGVVEHVAGNCKAAEKALVRARAIGKGVLRTEGALALGQCWLQDGQAPQAVELWTGMARQEPNGWAARLQAATTLAGAGERAGALKVLMLDGDAMDATAPPAAWSLAVRLAQETGRSDLRQRLEVQAPLFGSPVPAP